ncbi:hypothetical protein [Streptomyces carpaticus]|uniref:Uncharacterized protein n=1 Tax=Streptomyces carpaticus TaxID=285558 RepID=A0ABV4ZJ21_9ACTN
MHHDEPQWVQVTLDVALHQVRAWDFIEVGGRTERVESVTVLHNGRRIHFVHGGKLTLSTGRIVRVTRTVRENATAPEDVPFPQPSDAEGPAS